MNICPGQFVAVQFKEQAKPAVVYTWHFKSGLKWSITFGIRKTQSYGKD